MGGLDFFSICPIKDTFRILGELGFTFEKGLQDQIENLSYEAGKQSKFSDETVEQVIKPIIAFKISDVALLNKRTEVKQEDLGIVRGVCLRVIVCLRSSVIENPNVSASVLTSTDQRQLEIIGINKNDQLVNTPLDEIVNKTVKHISDSVPNFKISNEEVDLLKTRVKLWKYEAGVL